MPSLSAMSAVPPHSATAAAAAGSTSATVKRPLDLLEALRSTLRSWLVSRDAAVWCLCAGTNPDDRLDLIQSSDLLAATARMNTLRDVAYDFARQLSDKRRTAEDIMSDAIDELLNAEAPKFLLHDASVPGSF